jgi:hypothetical protein
MKHVKPIVELVALVAITVALVLFLNEARLLAKNLNHAVDDADRAIAKAETVEDSASAAAGQFTRQIAQQSADWQKAQLQVYKTITDTKQILVRTDRSLNDVLVPRAAASLDASVRLQNTAAEDLDRTMNELQPTFEHFAKTSAAAERAVSDPSIEMGLAEFSDAAASSATAAHEAAGAMTDVHKVTTYEAKVITAPVNTGKAIALEVARFAGKFFGF